MARLLRRSLIPALAVVSLSLTTAAQTPPAPRPEQEALAAAVAIKDPATRLDALEKIRADFPQANLGPADGQMLATLVNNFPDRADAIATVFDRIIGRIPADAAPEVRLSQTLTPVAIVVSKQLLLDRSETLVEDALAGMDLETYVQGQRDLAKRANRPEPARMQLEIGFNTARARALEQLARIDMAQAEQRLKAAVTMNPAFGTAQPALADMYLAKGDAASAEAVYKDAIKASTTPAVASRASMALADFYLKRGDAASAEAQIKDTLRTNPMYSAALLALARIEDKRGDMAHALEHYLTAASSGALPAADATAAHALYRKAHGSEAGFEVELDKIYREKFPNPVKPEPYTPAVAPKAANRIVLLEMFTGSGCGPCVSADLAMDAVMERYPPDAIVPVAYHANIPLPDPMVVPGGDGRREYYKVRGVPTFNIDGALGQLGGGARANTPGTYGNYILKIDKELAVPPAASINLSAIGEGELVSVTASVSKIATKSKDLRLHLLLVERELHYMGENGVRFHPMVVRAMAGDRGAGIPIKGNGTTKYTFDLTAIRNDITSTLAAELEKRRASEATGSAHREYAADGHPYTSIDLAALSVVAFVQDGGYVPAGAPPAAETAGDSVSPGAALVQTTRSAPPARPVPASGLAINVLQTAKADVVRKGGGN
ncbi:MAG TPA: tetratricopeptide repeat protein [Vicinamibacterales bacterium]|nr:tetratricopeptide repeat protein [Vicinamibacterales bacterium]